MSVNVVDEHNYIGHGTDWPPEHLPLDKAQKVVGFVSGRRGRLRLAPRLKQLIKALPTGCTHIFGTALWQSESGQGDHLLLWTDLGLYSTRLYQVWKSDERQDGPHSYYSLGAWSVVLVAVGGALQLYTIQFADELILSINGSLYRYYVTLDGLGTEYLYNLGMPTPSQPPLSGATGGSMTNGATYYYEVTYLDEKYRESSPSVASIIQLTAPTTTAVLVQQSATPYPSGNGLTYWRIYRMNPGSSTFNLVVELPIGTTSYTDIAADATVNLGEAAPSAGENDPPGNVSGTGQATIFCVWKDRLIMNNLADPSMVQVSNADSPTQFSSLPLPTNLADGLRFNIRGDGQNTVTGLKSLGSLLAVFGRQTTNLFYGDDISTFTLRPTLERGCQNPESIQRCENVILFLSDDGIYSIGYEDGYAVQKVSTDIDDEFRGWTATRDTTNPATTGRDASVQVVNALRGSMNSFYSEGRYYLSFGNRTLCLDVQTGGWTETGWGFVKTATRYFSQMANVDGSSPETVWLTIADQNTSATVMHYFTTADTPTDVDAPPTAAAHITMRPWDPSGAPLKRLKSPMFLCVFGETTAPRNTVIGTCRWFSEGRLVGVNTIYAGVAWRHEGALFEIAAPMYQAHLLWCELDFVVPDLSITNMLCEMSYLS